MIRFSLFIKASLAALVATMMIGCKEEIVQEVGVWKADDNNFIDIVESDGAYRAVVYRPSSWDSTFEKVEYPATVADGVLNFGLPSGPLPVLYRAEDDVIVVFGDTTYARADAETTRMELDTRLRQIDLDKKDCENLQNQINAARGTFPDKAACRAFMAPILEQRPQSCSLLFTSCNSF